MPRSDRPIRWLTVVGVTKDLKHYGLERPVRPGVYLPEPLYPRNLNTVVLKTLGDPAAIANGARAAVREVDPEIPAYDMRTMDERLALSRSLRAAYSWMLGVFAVMALLLALGGSYGVTSYLVSQRTRELGIRVALGARRGDISRTVLKGSLAVVSIGVAIGVAGAIGAGRFLASLLFGVPPYDALILTDRRGGVVLDRIPRQLAAGPPRLTRRSDDLAPIGLASPAAASAGTLQCADAPHPPPSSSCPGVRVAPTCAHSRPTVRSMSRTSGAPSPE